MSKLGLLPSEGIVQLKMLVDRSKPFLRREQKSAPKGGRARERWHLASKNVCDAHLVIVDNARKMVGRKTIRLDEDHVVKSHRREGLLPSVDEVGVQDWIGRALRWTG